MLTYTEFYLTEKNLDYGKRDQVEVDAKIFFMGIKNYMRDIENFKDVLASGKEKKYVDKMSYWEYEIPMRKLGIDSDLLKKYDAFDKIHIGTPIIEQKADNPQVIFGKVKSYISSRKLELMGLKIPYFPRIGANLQLLSFSFLDPKIIQSTSIEKIHSEFMKQFSDDFETFQHEFVHIKQRLIDKKLGGTIGLKPEDYYNHPKEVEAREKTFEYLVDRLVRRNPKILQMIDYIEKKKKSSLQNLLYAVSLNSAKVNRENWVHIYNEYTPENKKTLERVINKYQSKIDEVRKASPYAKIEKQARQRNQARYKAKAEEKQRKEIRDNLKDQIMRAARSSRRKPQEILRQFRVQVTAGKHSTSSVYKWIEKARHKDSQKVDMPKPKRKAKKLNTPPTKQSKPVVMDKGKEKKTNVT